MRPPLGPPPGRLVGVDDPMGRRIRLTWSPRHDLETLTDGEGRVTHYTHDLQGRLLASRDPLGRELTAHQQLISQNKSAYGDAIKKGCK